jgi:hypothetical protein
MAETTTYSGGCHCGAVRYRVTTAPLQAAMACNCSICSKTGSVLTFVPATQFELVSGGEALRDYQFGKKRIHHVFCPTCGIRSFARGAKPDGTPMVAVNVRCLEGVDVAALDVKPFDGKSLPVD